MTLEELLHYCQAKALWNLDEAKRLNFQKNFARAGNHCSMAEAYSDVGMKLEMILLEMNHVPDSSEE